MAKKLTEDDRLDRVALAVVSAVDYDHAKQLDEATAEEPDEVEHNRRVVRDVLRKALKKNGYALPKGGKDA